MANAVDKEQIEMLKTWWNEYGKSISIAVVVGLVLGFGWRYWVSHEKKEAQNASALYSQIQKGFLAEDENVVSNLAKTMQQTHKGSVYADMASMIAAKVEVDKKKFEKALVNLRWVVDEGSQDEFRQLATINVARILLEQKKNDQAMKVLEKIYYKPFMPLVERAKGDVYFAMGHKALAKQAYQKAASGLSEMKMEDPYLSLLINQSE